MNIPSGGMHEDASFLDNYLPYVLRRADQMLSAPFYEVLTQHDVGRSEWRVLAVLAQLGELTVLELAAASLSPQPTVTHALRRLEKRGLIKSTTDPEDKRRRLVSTTDSGSELTSTLISHARRLEGQALASAGDLTALVDQLTELTALVESHRDHIRSTAKAG